MEKWKFKEIVKILLLCFIPFIIVCIMSIASVGREALKMFFPLIYTMLGMLGIVIIIYLSTNLMKIKSMHKSKNYNREIDDKLTPALVSLLLDKYFEKNEVILATILDLHVKKYINISKKNDKMQIEVLNKNIDKLYSHEKYIMKSIKDNQLISIQEFQRIVEEDLIKSNLMKYNKKLGSVLAVLFLGSLFGFFIGPLMMEFDRLYPIPQIITACSGIILLLLRFGIMSNISVLLRTDEGNKIAKEIKELKNFLKDYTLLKDKEIDYINLADRYMAFALALGEADKIERRYVAFNDLISEYIKKEEF